MTLLKLLAAGLIVLLFVYDKLSPNYVQLHSKYRKPYLVITRYLKPILDKLNQVVKPIPIGQSIQLELAPIILVIVLLIIIL